MESTVQPSPSMTSSACWPTGTGPATLCNPTCSVDMLAGNWPNCAAMSKRLRDQSVLRYSMMPPFSPGLQHTHALQQHQGRKLPCQEPCHGQQPAKLDVAWCFRWQGRQTALGVRLGFQAVGSVGRTCSLKSETGDMCLHARGSVLVLMRKQAHVKLPARCELQCLKAGRQGSRCGCTSRAGISQCSM